MYIFLTESTWDRNGFVDSHFCARPKVKKGELLHLFQGYYQLAKPNYFQLHRNVCRTKVTTPRTISNEYGSQITATIIWHELNNNLCCWLFNSGLYLDFFFTTTNHIAAQIFIYSTECHVLLIPLMIQKFISYWSICCVLLLVALWYLIRCLAINLVKFCVTVNYYISVWCGQYQCGNVCTALHENEVIKEMTRLLNLSHKTLAMVQNTSSEC